MICFDCYPPIQKEIVHVSSLFNRQDAGQIPVMDCLLMPRSRHILVSRLYKRQLNPAPEKMALSHLP